MLGPLRSMRLKGVRYMAEFSGKARELGIKTIAEGTALGVVMAVWWRYTHTQEKLKYDKYYAQLRADLAAGGAED